MKAQAKPWFLNWGYETNIFFPWDKKHPTKR